MLNARRPLVLVLGSCLLFLLHCDQPLEKYYRIKSLWTKDVHRMTPADMNSDGVDEIIQTSEGQLDIVDQSLRHHYKSMSMTEYRDFHASPITGSSLDSVSFYIFSKSEDTILVDLLSHTKRGALEQRIKKPIYRFARPHRVQRSHYEQNISAISSIKTAAGALSLFKFTNARSLTNVRGLVLYDPQKRKELWRYTTGPQIRSPIFTNMDADPAREIVFGSYASDNGLEMNGTRDDSSYAFMLDDNGRLLWRKAFGGQFSGVFTYPGRFRPQGHQIAAITQNLSSLKSFSESISILDAESGELITGPRIYGDKIPAVDNSYFTRAADMNRNGMDEIVIGNSDGFVRILDNNLNLLYISKHYDNEIQVRAIVDMNGDGFNEVVCIVHYDKIVILNYMLQEMASFSLAFQKGLRLYTVKNSQTARLLLFTPFNLVTGEINLWHLLELQESFIPFEAYTGAAKYFWWGIGGFALLGVLLISFSTRKSFFTRLFLRLLMQANLFDSAMLVNKKGVVRAAGAHWLQLANMPAEFVTGRKLVTLEHIPPAIRTGIEKRLKEQSATQFKVNIDQDGRKMPILVQMEYIKTLAQWRVTLHFISQERFTANIKQWSAAAQKLAHSIKNPLTSMKLNLDELAEHLEEEQAAAETMEHTRSIGMQINKLRRMADGFTRFIEFEEPVLSAMNVNEFIEKTLAQLCDDIPNSISISLDLNRALPSAMINEEQLRFAFENVLVNAVQSIEDHGTVIIQTSFVQLSSPDALGDFVEILIQDNGVGIEPDMLSKVINPYFTTKREGTGLGLNLVVKIMQMHDGEFDIQSQPGQGTVVTLRLKAAA